MRIVCTVAVAALLCCGSAAQGYEGPWCAQMNVGSGTMVQDCSMRSFEQCRLMVIAGNRGFCSANPRYGVRARRHR
jgi:Protein of unknown function (DUF3551)